MWTRCTQGHTHWGRHGAAGLLLRHRGDDAVRYLLQHRAPVVHHGDTWGVPGGAIESGETPESAAWREAHEELGLVPDPGLTVAALHVDDHGGWSYSTLVIDSPRLVSLTARNFETGLDGCRWFSAEEVARQRLHPGLALSWSSLVAL